MNRTRPTVQDAIGVIKAAGGVAIWAHPFWDLDDPQEVVDTIVRFKGYGVDGIEVFYPTHDEEQTKLLHATCTEHGLLKTGSADFHGPEHGKFSRLRCLRALRARARPGPDRLSRLVAPDRRACRG